MARTQLGGYPVQRIALFSGGRMAQAPLPGVAVSVSRRRLDACLLARAEQAGAAVEQRVAARGFEHDHLSTNDGAIRRPDRVVLVTGKHDLRGLARLPTEGARMVGLRWRLGFSPRLSRMLAGTIELHCFRGGYGGLVMQEGTANLCLAVTQARLAQEGTPEALLLALARECPALDMRLSAASEVSGRQAIANMPYGCRAKASRPARYRMGDQAGSSLRWREKELPLPSRAATGPRERSLRGAAERFQPDLARRLRRPIGGAGAIAGWADHPVDAGAMVRLVGPSPLLARIAAQLARVRPG